MDYEEAFGSDVGPVEFFRDKLPALHRDRLDKFELYSETTLRFCIRFTDLDEAVTVELRSDGARAIEGEMIDFPIVTFEATTDHWEPVRDRGREVFERIEGELESTPPDHRITDELLRELERYDAVIDLEVRGPELESPLEMRMILNDYEAVPGGDELEARGESTLLDELMEGDRGVADAARSLDLSGDLGFAFDLGGLFMSHFPELDE